MNPKINGISLLGPVDPLVKLTINDCQPSILKYLPYQVRGAVIITDEKNLNSLSNVVSFKKEIESYISNNQQARVGIFMTLNVNRTSHFEEITAACNRNSQNHVVAIRLSNYSKQNPMIHDIPSLKPLFRFLEHKNIPLYLNPKLLTSETLNINPIKREKYFITHTLPRILKEVPKIKIVLEKIKKPKTFKFIKNISQHRYNIYAIFSPQSVGLANGEINNRIKEVISSTHFRFGLGGLITKNNMKSRDNLQTYVNFLKENVTKKNTTFSEVSQKRLENIFQKITSENISQILNIQPPSTYTILK